MEDGSDIRNTEKPKTVKGFFTSRLFWKPLIFVLVGVLAGFLYYYFIGCNSGSCAITGKPFNSMLAGGLFGYLLEGSFTKDIK